MTVSISKKNTFYAKLIQVPSSKMHEMQELKLN